MTASLPPSLLPPSFPPPYDVDDEPDYTRERSRSFSYPSATLPDQGIRLGTLTAQIASKSFWTREMLLEALKQMGQASMKELNEPSHKNNEQSLTVSDFFYSEENIEPAEGEREWRSPRSSFDVHENSNGYFTPPYLSPGITRKLRLSKDLQLPFLKGH